VIVAAVKRQLEERGRATVSQLAAELGESRDLVASAVEMLLQRGRVYRESGDMSSHCGVSGCSRCPLADACAVDAGTRAAIDVYVWNQERKR
jgi:hypothetical protein